MSLDNEPLITLRQASQLKWLPSPARPFIEAKLTEKRREITGLEKSDESKTELDEDGRYRLGNIDPDSGKVILSPKQTLPSAVHATKTFWTHPQGRIIHNYAGEIMVWDRNRYSIVEERQIKKNLHELLHKAKRYVRNVRTGEFDLIDFDANRKAWKVSCSSLRNWRHP